MQVAHLRPWQAQPRRQFAESTLKELAESIRQNGLISPLVVRPTDEGYQIIAGERRWRAAQIAGISEVPVVVRQLSDHDALVLALVENLQREDLNLMDRARGLRKLHEQLGNWEAVGKAVGYGESRVDSMVKPLTERRMFQINALNDLPAPVQEAIAQGSLNEKHGRAIGRVKDPVEQERLLETIQRHHLSGPETEGVLRVIQQEEQDGFSLEKMEEVVAQVRAPRASERVVRNLHQRMDAHSIELLNMLQQSQRSGKEIAQDDPLLQSLERLQAGIRDWRRSKALNKRNAETA
jgi:ParB family chromosome partitioning protein